MSLITCLRQTVPALQPQLEAVQGAHTFEPMLCAAWKLGLSVAVLIVQEVVTARAQAPTPPTLCPKCGKVLQSKGFLKRHLRTMRGGVLAPPGITLSGGMSDWSNRAPGRRFGVDAPSGDECGRTTLGLSARHFCAV